MGWYELSRRADLQYLEDRLDPVGVVMLVDERSQDLSLWSSSLDGKKALASLESHRLVLKIQDTPDASSRISL